MKKIIVFLVIIGGLLAFLIPSITAKVDNANVSTEDVKNETNNGSKVDKVELSNEILVDIGSIEGKAGETVTIPVSFSNIPEKGISACDFKLKYDDSVLEAIDVTAGDTVLNPDEDFDFNTENTGIIAFLFLDNTLENRSIKEDGVFANINFKIKEAVSKKTTGIELSHLGAFCEIKDDDVQKLEAQFQSGKITIIE